MSVEKQEALKSMLHKMSQELFEQNNRPMSTLYIDMEALYDYKFTALLKSIQYDIEYEYVLSQLPIYNRAANRQVVKYFPALKYQETALDLFLQDPLQIPWLSNAAVATSIFSAVPILLQGFIHNNNMLMYRKDDPITIYFVNRLFLPDLAYRMRIAAACKAIHSNVKVIFRQQDIAYEDIALLNTVDQFVLDNINRLLETQGTFHDLMYKEKAFLTTPILAAEYFDDSIDGTTIADEDRHKLFHNTTEALGLFGCVYFLKKYIELPTVAGGIQDE